MNIVKLKATKNDIDRSLFKFLIKHLNNVPVSRIEKLFRKKDVKVNNVRTNQKQYKIQEFDVIEVYGIEDVKINQTSFNTKIDFKTIFEDNNILVVEKPINIAIHGEDNCLDHQVLTYLKYKQIDSFKPSHIGRLDKSTSGIMIYAKTYKALVELNKKTNYFEKYYHLKSDFPWKSKRVILYSQFNKNKNQIEVNEKEIGQKMETIFFQDQDKKYAQIITGKKHQIRLSLQYLKYPIYGDIKYGGKWGKRVYLHCCKIVFHNLENDLEYLNGIAFVCNIKW